MQFFILLLGAMVFIFYQFEKPPVFFNRPAYQRAIAHGAGPQLKDLSTKAHHLFEQKREALRAYAAAPSPEKMQSIRELDARAQAVRTETKQVLNQNGADPRSKESDYVFITFILQELPRAVVGLLVAVIFFATMCAPAAARN